MTPKLYCHQLARRKMAGALSKTLQRRNHRIAKTFARIEHVFARLAQMGGKALRSIDLARATLRLNWKVAAYNLLRLAYLKEAKITTF